MRIPLTGRIGIVLTAVGIASLICTVHWLAPRPLVALDIPVSLAPGHIVTGDFDVYSDAAYYIDIEMERPGNTPTAGCKPYSVLRTQWTLSSGGQVVGRGSSPSPWEDTSLTVGHFFGDDPRYTLDVGVFPGASCLNTGRPRLKVRTHPDASDLYICLIWPSVWSIGCGLVLVVRFWLWEVLIGRATLRIFPGMVLRNVLPFQRHRPIQLLKDLPNFGLVCGCILWVLIIIFMTITPRTPNGLLVNLGVRDVVAWQKSPWPETLSVYVGGRERFYVNGQLIPRDELRAKLSEELGKRMVWTVYFEADDDCEFADAIYSIETIQGLGAKVVWITPQVRAELNREMAQ